MPPTVWHIQGVRLWLHSFEKPAAEEGLCDKVSALCSRISSKETGVLLQCHVYSLQTCDKTDCMRQSPRGLGERRLHVHGSGRDSSKQVDRLEMSSILTSIKWRVLKLHTSSASARTAAATSMSELTKAWQALPLNACCVQR